MSRNHKDWLQAYVNYASFSEAPKRMHFWCGVSAIAGALRRKVWIDQKYFRWYANMYIILVAPPGIVSKSSTANISMSLLRAIPGINFGPDVVTWQALVTAFANSSESFLVGDEWHPMCAMTIESSEFGNLLNPQDRDMVDLMVALWDGKQGTFTKETKMSGKDSIENPWINLLACTTPSWIAGNFPEYMIGGGFTSRCIFVYADQKDKLVAYPYLHVPKDMEQTKASLIQDLEHISVALVGEYQLDKAAVEWGEKWYEDHYTNKPANLDEDRFGGYIARKQTHMHKLSMIMAASCRDEQVITRDDLETANQMISTLEGDMTKVFDKIGRSDVSNSAERLVNFILKKGEMPVMEAYRYIHQQFPDAKDFEGVLSGIIKAGYVDLIQTPNGMFVKARITSS